MKTIGIAAHSAEGASLCYLTCVHEGEKALGPHIHPEIVLSSIAMGHAMPAWESEDHTAARKLLAEGIAVCAKAGADFFVMPDNTAHIALETGGADLALPGLHIADVVAEEAARRRFRKIAVLGTKWTMTGPVYEAALARRGMKRVVPDEAARDFINTTIFDELCRGVFKPATTGKYIEVIERLKGEGCEAVVLGCTEIPIIVSDRNSPLPTLDSTRLLARAAVAAALGKRAMPAWRGGPIR